MNARTVLNQCKHNPLLLSPFGISRFSTALSRSSPSASRLKERHFPPCRRKPHPTAHFSTSIRMSPAPPTHINGEPQLSNRTPDTFTNLNMADQLERLMQTDGFRKWGFAIYRCTYASDSDWEAFIARIYEPVKRYLKYDNGLDMLGSFAPTVIQDRAAFEGATTATVREHFINTWVPGAFPVENPGLDMGILPNAEVGRYRFFIMVDEESLRSVLDAPENRINQTGFVRLVQADWGSIRSRVDNEEDDDGIVYTPEECEPLEGCTKEDVGWMKVHYDRVETVGYLDIRMHWDWEDHYSRPPEIAELL